MIHKLDNISTKFHMTAFWKRPFLISLILITATTWLSAQTPAGLAILNSSMGNDPRNVTFKSISWPNPNSAAVTELDGNRVVFDQAEITKIIYFDQDFYDRMTHDYRVAANRGGVQTREIVIPVHFSTVESDQDCGQVEASCSQLKEIEDRFPSTATDLKTLEASLQAIISKYKGGQREVMGTWMSQEELAAQSVPTPKQTASPKLSFTTKDNQHFDNVTISLSDIGVYVMTSDGGTTLTFDQLPDDLTGFPEPIRKAVDEQRLELKKAEAEKMAKLNEEKELAESSTLSGKLKNFPLDSIMDPSLIIHNKEVTCVKNLNPVLGSVKLQRIELATDTKASDNRPLGTVACYLTNPSDVFALIPELAHEFGPPDNRDYGNPAVISPQVISWNLCSLNGVPCRINVFANIDSDDPEYEKKTIRFLGL